MEANTDDDDDDDHVMFEYTGSYGIPNNVTCVRTSSRLKFH